MTERYRCDHCDAIHDDRDLGDTARCVFPGSLEEPPEYEDVCPTCGRTETMALIENECDELCGREAHPGGDLCAECWEAGDPDDWAEFQREQKKSTVM